ncbi:MAG: tRNA (adenosine(37)-N6)-threonylcarbamoyltransferase complex dimerization subunit type 1 TsaB [Flavobacteriales bacterium]|nr:tRNA (adenosine(37)-N6)-threonylcarbamoyltransferase complex dimerization subunit type 1 TsaB [Flavobacteriales bacterium]
METSTRLCSVAVSRGMEVLAEREADEDRLVHAEKLHGFFDEVLKIAGVSYTDLSAIAVGIGPGSYTGLRIGLSAAKGLCYALDTPIIGIGTLEVLCAELQQRSAVDPSLELMPMIDARRMEVFTARHDASGQAAEEVRAMVLDENSMRVPIPVLVFGDGADKAEALWEDHGHVTHVPGVRPMAAALCMLAHRRFQQGAFDDLAYLVPAYGKPANLTTPRRGA